MRVLHLIDPGSPGGGACTLQLLAEANHRLTSVQHRVAIIGHRWHEELARRCGVKPIGHINPALGSPLLGRRPLQRLVSMYEAAEGPFDIVHSWTPQSALLATSALPEHKHLATFPVGPVSGLATELFLRRRRRHRMPLLVSSIGVLREYESLGVPSQQMSVLPAGVNPESVSMAPRHALRDQWGFDHRIDDHETLVVGLLSEPLSWADVRTAATVVSRVAASGRDVRLVVHHSAYRRAEAELWMRDMGMGDLLIIDDNLAEPWRVVNGIDVALLIGGELNAQDLSGTGSPYAMITGGGRRLRPMPGIMPLLWAMAAGVPVVAEAGDAVRDIVEEGRTGLFVSQGDVNTAADRILRLYDDRTMARRIGAAAAEVVEERFHISAYCVRLRETYQRIVDNLPLHEQPEDLDETASEEAADILEHIDEAEKPVQQWGGRIDPISRASVVRIA